MPPILGFRTVMTGFSFVPSCRSVVLGLPAVGSIGPPLDSNSEKHINIESKGGPIDPTAGSPKTTDRHDGTNENCYTAQSDGEDEWAVTLSQSRASKDIGAG
jgi:hypothetical protein